MVRQPMKWAGFATSVVLLIALTTAVANDQAPYPVPFGLSGSGSMLNDPPMFQGMIISGPMAGGSFVIQNLHR